MDSQKAFTNQVIIPLFASIEKFPERNSFCINEVFFSYKQLGAYISKIRSAVKKLRSDDVYIGLVVNDDIETYASIFSLWLERKSYIPLHPNQPVERCEDIISQMNIKTILDSGAVTKFSHQHVINTGNLSYQYDDLEFKDEIDENVIAYILFTSGSTGKPKGVTITRENVGAFMESFWDCGIEIDETDRCLQCFDLTFDVSVQSFLAPLVKGACIYTIPHDQIKYSYVYGLLSDQNLTFGAMAPSMLRYLRPYFKEINLPGLNNCILTAEASPMDLVQAWQTCIPNAQIYDFYGPTEATIYCTFYKLNWDKPNKTLNGMLSIGKPMKNINAIIIDENKNILPKGKKGELCVSGNQITPGYWNDTVKNSQAFFEMEYKNAKHRFYRTGDLCYFDNDDFLMLYGRIDSQVKIQGYRVEPGEIEFYAREFLNGNNAVVITFTNNSNNMDLALFIEGENTDTVSLVYYLKAKIPLYMIPTKFIHQKSFPLNSNGKVDKIKLKEALHL